MKAYLILNTVKNWMSAVVLAVMFTHQPSLFAVDMVKMDEVKPFDISVMYPLPSPTTEDYFIRDHAVSLVDGKGIIPNRDRYLGDFKDSLYLLGFRVDPCFPGNVESLDECSAQIRLIMQPVKFESAIDDAFHLFFELDKDSLKQFIKSMVSIRQSLEVDMDQKPLGVHPGFLGKDKEVFATRVNQLLLNTLQASQFIRVTSVLGHRGRIWTFSGIDVTKEGETEPMVIKGLRKLRPDQIHTSQTFHFDLDGFHAFIPGIDQRVDHIEYLASANSFRFRHGDEHKLKDSLRDAHKIENPDFHNPTTTDCASCHVARQTTQKGSRLGPVDVSDIKYQLPVDMNEELVTEPSFQNTRAFGYFTTLPTVSKRTIHETSAVMQFLREHY